jgi:hypothetical protein
MPYDPKLGLTEPEYREFVALSEGMEMRPGQLSARESLFLRLSH